MSLEHEYHLGNHGRVKAAGVTFEPFYDPAHNFDINPSAQTAADTTQFFRKLRDNPPKELRDRFFPTDRADIKAFMRGSPALTRPVLKTDQGQGQFLKFEVRYSSHKPGGGMRNVISDQTGFCILEPHFQAQLKRANNPAPIMAELDMLQIKFTEGDLDEARLAYERLGIECEKLGISMQRQAKVGRDGLFFIHPSKTKEPIFVDFPIFESIREIAKQQIRYFEELSQVAKARFAHNHGKRVEKREFEPPIYFQMDVQCYVDGSVVLDQVQMPDLGLFLLRIDTAGNKVLEDIQNSVLPLTHDVISAIANTVATNTRSEDLKVYAITRPEVINDRTDVLELYEIQALKRYLQEYGISVLEITPQEALNLGPDDTAIILNVDTQDAQFQQLLLSYLSGNHAKIYPDPFLLLAMPEMTGYKRVRLLSQDIINFRALVSDIETQPEKLFRQMMGLNQFLDKLGVNTEVLHIHISSQPTPIACLRNDLRGFQLAAKEIKEDDQVVIRCVPLTPKQAVLFDPQQRPVYSVFRFMVTRRVL